MNENKMIPVRDLIEKIGMASSSVRSLGISITGEMPLQEAIEFASARTVAGGRRTTVQAKKAKNALVWLQSLQIPTSDVQTTLPMINQQSLDVQPSAEKQPASFEHPSFFVSVDWTLFGFRTICVLIVVAHAWLIWKDAAIIWGSVGELAGAMAFLFQCGALLVSTDSSRVRTSQYAVYAVAAIDAAAWFLHYPAFIATKPDVSNTTTGIMCAFLCAISFAALSLYRDSKLD